MGSRGPLRGKEDGRHASDAELRIERAERGEVHALLEVNDLAHGKHSAVAPAQPGTMKCAGFQGGAP
jgi:hypothetical protein